jgi:hypothetical protein
MDDLRLRLERFVREGTTSAGAPSVLEIRRRARRHRQRQVAGALLAAVVLSSLALGPGQGLARRLGGAGAAEPLTRPPSEVATPPSDSRNGPVNEWIQFEGRPIPPVVLVARGVFEGSYWEYLAYRTDRGKVCGQWHSPDAVERLRRSTPGSIINVDGRDLTVGGGGCGFVFGTSGFRDRNRTATDFEASLPVRDARVRIKLDGRPPMVLRPAGRKELGRGFIAIRLPDLAKVRELIAYDEQGRVVYHGKANTNLTRGLGGLDFTPIRSK